MGSEPTNTPAKAGLLVDGFNRTARDLRVSLTDKCNLRCTYCMPAEGLAWMPRDEILTNDEVVRLVGLFVRCGITTVRLTGGEPLIRRGLVDIVQRIKQLPEPPTVAMTTNGLGLERLAGDLAAAGLDRVNVSLDTIDQQTYASLTRRDRLEDVLAGLRAAQAAHLDPVKVNAVLMRGINHDPRPLARYCLERGLSLRFIEQMPLDAGHTWSRADMITREEILEALSSEWHLQPLDDETRGSAPAQLFSVGGGPATIGIIASVSQAFCSTCDRVRLTSDGQVRNCLFARTETPLRDAMRRGADDDELFALVQSEMSRKKRGHGIGEPDFVQPERPMSAIGG